MVSPTCVSHFLFLNDVNVNTSGTELISLGLFSATEAIERYRKYMIQIFKRKRLNTLITTASV